MRIFGNDCPKLICIGICQNKECLKIKRLDPGTPFAQDVYRFDVHGVPMICQRCQEEGAEFRVITDAISIAVCSSCAEQARQLKLATEILPRMGRSSPSPKPTRRSKRFVRQREEVQKHGKRSYR